MLDIFKAILSNQFVAFIIVVGVVVLVHEFGHFCAARLFGIFVEEFSIGFGPKAFSFKIGATEYRIGWLPFGGYVRLFGAEPGQIISPEMRRQSISHAPLPQRMLVSFAGPLANAILTFVFMIVLSAIGMEQMPPQLAVMPKSVAAQSGLRDGDVVMQINGKNIVTWEHLTKEITKNSNNSLDFLVSRLDKLLHINVTPAATNDESVFGEKVMVGRIGVSFLFQTPQIVFSKNSFADYIGFAQQDKIIAINNKPIKFFHEIQNALEQWKNEVVSGNNNSILFTVERTNNNKIVTEQVFANVNKLETWLGMGAVLGKEFILKDFVYSTDLTLMNNSVPENQAAQKQWEQCGLRAGQTIIAMDAPLTSKIQLLNWLEDFKESSTSKVNITVLDNLGATRLLSCIPPVRQGRDHLNRKRAFIEFPFTFLSRGLTPSPVLVKSSTWYNAVNDGFNSTVDMGNTILTTVYKLFAGKIPFSNLGGPGEILRVAGSAAKIGFQPFFYMIAFISINVGLINLLPIPVLDGGTLLLLFIESIYGKPLPIRLQEYIQRFGVMFMLILFALVIYNDILRWISQ